MLNPSRPYGIWAVGILCFSLLLFFYNIPRTISKNVIWKRLTQTSGTISMICLVLVFTNLHNIMIGISSVFGLFALIGIMKGVFTTTWTFFKYAGLFCIFLLVLNNVMYYTNFMVYWLPLLQKISFAVVLFWMMGLNFKLISVKK